MTSAPLIEHSNRVYDDDIEADREVDCPHHWASGSKWVARFEFLKRYFLCLRELHPGYQQMLIFRFIFVVIFLVICLWIMSAMAIIAAMRAPENVPDLPDLGFELLPPLLEQDSVTNTLIYITGTFTLIRCIFHRRGLTILRRFAFLWAVLLMGRCTTLVATSYPDPSRNCRTYQAPPDLMSFFIESVYRPGLVTCGDLMYSGHTVFFTLIGLMWSYYSVYPFEKLVWLPISLSIVLLVATRLHYLNDVIVAFYMTILGWYFYHIIATEPALRKYSRLILWLEKDIITWEDDHPQESREIQYRCMTFSTSNAN